MFVFGHVGFTWGGTLLLARLRPWLPARGRQPGARAEAKAGPPPASAIDYRVVILGSLLPDLLDKPLGVFILGDELGNGRIFGHSLLFVALLLLAALLLRRRVGSALALLALGSAAHVALDRPWLDANAVFWPLLGWRPEKQDVSDWLEQMLEQLFSEPYTYVSEVAGALVVVALLASLVARGGLRKFALTGGMGWPAARPPAPGLGEREERPQQLKRGERPAER